jgi:hypothetical protein
LVSAAKGRLKTYCGFNFVAASFSDGLFLGNPDKIADRKYIFHYNAAVSKDMFLQ